MTRAFGAVAVLVLQWGCEVAPPGPGKSDAGEWLGEPIAGLQSLEITSAETRHLVKADRAPLHFTVKGQFADGTSRDVSSRVLLSVSDPELGQFQGSNLFPAHRGGQLEVTARAGSITATTWVTLVLSHTFTADGSVLPVAPPALFNRPATGVVPSLVYPNDGVVIPPNLSGLEFHFMPGAGNTVFELSFVNALTEVTIFMSCLQPSQGGCLYQPPDDLWRRVARTNRGGESIQVGLRATAPAAAGVGIADPLTVTITSEEIRGGLYYWTTSNGTGIMRVDLGTMNAAPERYLDSSHAGGACIGCHALSRDGKKIVAEVGGENNGRLLLLDVATKEPLASPQNPERSIFESWNPDGSRYVGVYGDSGATDYRLMVMDGETGVKLSSIEGTGTQARPADHPDWSADGLKIAYARVGIAGTLQKMFKASIELVIREGDRWSAPVTVVPQVAGRNHFFPAFAPDSTFLVYNEARCPDGFQQHVECNADSDPTATLYAVQANAGSLPIHLANASGPGKRDGTTTALANTYPKWNPFEFTRSTAGGRLMWLTFSSTRKYGLRNPPAGGAENPSGTLIWMAAIDPDKVARGEDPSSPAFVLPFQDIKTSNHIAQWTTQVEAACLPDEPVCHEGQKCPDGWFCLNGCCAFVP